MAKKSMIAREVKRERLVNKFAEKRAELKAVIANKALDPSERFMAVLQLQKLPRNSSRIRMHNRCGLTGRPHAVYRRFNISRIALRELGSSGRLPGVIKSSW
ncbi:MAG: 30S ribosomal protein S14 [Kiloniella sp.]|nr:30S ribosomal protein S14 [Kiloniella sp.]